jgi:hypothetical protein
MDCHPKARHPGDQENFTSTTSKINHRKPGSFFGAFKLVFSVSAALFFLFVSVDHTGESVLGTSLLKPLSTFPFQYHLSHPAILHIHIQHEFSRRLCWYYRFRMPWSHSQHDLPFGVWTLRSFYFISYFHYVDQTRIAMMNHNRSAIDRPIVCASL